MKCPMCGSENLKRGKQNLFCADCGFFPILYQKQKANLRNLIKRIFYGDIAVKSSCCAFWAGDEKGINEMPAWARQEIETLMEEEQIAGLWRDGLAFILDDEHSLADDKDDEYNFSWDA